MELPAVVPGLEPKPDFQHHQRRDGHVPVGGTGEIRGGIRFLRGWWIAEGLSKTGGRYKRTASPTKGLPLDLRYKRPPSEALPSNDIRTRDPVSG